ncbi:MAG: HEAT repeat domain-containing protein [Acidobacteria bacterium]|nr:HEAT repeat domain-containing protein [Acidobacteriota bacterium]
MVTGCDVYDHAMDSAVSSGDHGEISRAFHAATYDKRSGLESTRRSLKRYLEHTDPVVRFLAAKYLYVLGDDSGYDALIDMIQSGDDIALHKRDLRLWAIDLLQQYREKRATPAIYRFFTQTKSIDAFNALLRLAGKNAPVDPLSAYPDARPYPATTVFSLALKNPLLATELASATFEDPKCPDTYAEQSRQIAAWALLRAGAGEPYLSYLRGQADKAIAGDRPPAGKDTNQYREALEYLASVNGSPVKGCWFAPWRAVTLGSFR